MTITTSGTEGNHLHQAKPIFAFKGAPDFEIKLLNNNLKKQIERREFCFLQTDGKSTWSKKEEHHTVFDLLKSHNIRATTLILCLVW